MNWQPSEDQVLEAVAKLTEDGEYIEFSGEHGVYRLVLHIGHDPDSTINDYDTYGQLSKWTRDNDYGSQRPAGFGPHARIIGRDRDSTIWWQPLPELWGTPKPWTPATFEQDWQLAKNLWEEGFHAVGVSVHETLYDSDNQPHLVEVRSAWLGGIDSLSGGYLADVVSDLLADLFPDR